MTEVPMQSETGMISLEKKKELEKEHLMKQKYLAKQKKELTDKITYVVPEQQAAERTLAAETEKLKKHKGQEKQTTESQPIASNQYIPSLQKSRKKAEINFFNFQMQQKWTVLEDDESEIRDA